MERPSDEARDLWHVPDELAPLPVMHADATVEYVDTEDDLHLPQHVIDVGREAIARARAALDQPKEKSTREARAS